MLSVCGGVAVLGGIVGYLVTGAAGAIGAIAGVALVMVSYLVSTLAIAWADSVDPQLVLAVGLSVYVVKFTALGLAMVAILQADWSGTVPMAWGIAAGVVAWTAAQIWWTVRAVS